LLTKFHPAVQLACLATSAGVERESSSYGLVQSNVETALSVSFLMDKASKLVFL